MNCDDVRDLLEEYALDLLDPAEREQVARHVAGCPDCARELAALESLLSRLPDALTLAIGDEMPPAQTRQRLHERIREAEARPWPNPETTMPRRRLVSLWTPARIATAIVLLALVVSVGWGFRLNQALSEERQLRTQLGDQQEIVLEIVDGQDTIRRVLQPPPGDDSRSYGKVFTRPTFNEVVIMAGRLPVAPEGQAYHVWLIANGETRLAGTLEVNDDGFGLLVIDVGEPGLDYESVIVTLQPEGADQPGGLTVLTWPS